MESRRLRGEIPSCWLWIEKDTASADGLGKTWAFTGLCRTNPMTHVFERPAFWQWQYRSEIRTQRVSALIWGLLVACPKFLYWFHCYQMMRWEGKTFLVALACAFSFNETRKCLSLLRLEASNQPFCQPLNASRSELKASQTPDFLFLSCVYSHGTGSVHALPFQEKIKYWSEEELECEGKILETRSICWGQWTHWNWRECRWLAYHPLTLTWHSTFMRLFGPVRSWWWFLLNGWLVNCNGFLTTTNMVWSCLFLGLVCSTTARVPSCSQRHGPKVRDSYK